MIAPALPRRPTVAILGCGNRGADVYARHLEAQGAEVAWLVDPRPGRLAEVAARHGLGPERCFSHWDDFFALGRVADAVVIATPDDRHVEPGVRALGLDYDVLLEKPVCLDEAGLGRFLRAEGASRGRVTVCHVLRTTPFVQAVFGVLRSGRLGQLRTYAKWGRWAKLNGCGSETKCKPEQILRISRQQPDQLDTNVFCRAHR